MPAAFHDTAEDPERGARRVLTMAGIPLTAEERAELAGLYKNPERFHSDGREVTWACVTVPLLCLPLMAVLWKDVSSEWRQLQAGELRIGTSLVFMAPELFGFVALFALAVAATVYGVRTYGRHGVAISSFGVARVRGGVKKLIRYSEMDSATFSERRHPQHRIITDELEVKARDGRTILLYGFNAGQRKRQIEAEWQRATAGGR